MIVGAADLALRREQHEQAARLLAASARVLGLVEIPRPADAADALALAICHGWRGGATAPDAGSTGGLTPAQRAWRAAEKSSAKRRL